ncbi:acyl-CoA thioesterase-1 [Altererythrobacter atlanticus]|uniref:Arylesterase n=1 Tax=Croceibacterium atlanticum TaxID=1267766 RepID=A0A0F7KU87_9SPHN|nr:arylesterase [Croceibacterium atlanticum]AKH42350.1 Arylesterase precursor [Croceibacterium atlanticum]MBB5731127.1 acyl-CoA thioesterase-1 [Croceibacterium atlanticum]
MRAGNWSIILMALACAACGGDAPDPEPAADQQQEAEALPVMGPQLHILAFGDSLFAGYGVGLERSYPAMLQNALRARGINAEISNAGVSGDTTAAGLGRIEFVLDNESETPDLAIVELGGNDLLRGISPAETRENLAGILEILKQRNIPVLLMGMRAPPNLGDGFVGDFDAIYPELAEQYDVELVPFFLEAVYDKPELIQQDRIHPTAEGIEALVAATADDVAEALPEEDEE